MKKFAFLLSCLALLMQSFAQTPVTFQVTAARLSAQSYLLVATGTISKGWHVYAAQDEALGLAGCRIVLDPEGVTVHSETRSDGHSFADPIFNQSLPVYTDSFSVAQVVDFEGAIPANLQVTVTAFASDNAAFLPLEHIQTVPLEGGTVKTSPLRLESVKLDEAAADCGDHLARGASLFSIFLKGIAGGLIALLMPCLFPMIPVTVSFFTNRAASRRQAIRFGAAYGLSILSIYIAASLPFHFISGVNAQLFNTIATNAWVNLAFFVIFLLFALSLFGLFEIRLPSILTNKAGNKSNIASLPGIFFMALTLALVSFSCTGPILGTLLVGSLSEHGNPWELSAGMAGFGLALALPFTIFAIFPSWLNRLPKSGSWMVRVKKVLAFVELALAFKFLSNADLVEHWGILKREIFIGIWVAITIALGLYLAGLPGTKKIRGDMRVVHPVTKFRWIRPLSATVCFLFALYLIPGLTNSSYANLKLVSGFPPPLSYSLYQHESSKGVEPDVVNDYEKALALSKLSGKPLLIDFTGWACVNCRKMEEQVWTQPAIKKLIREKFILVSLYVDDRQKLPAPQQFQFNERIIKTLGDKWATFQAVNFGGASQPMYVVLSPGEKLLNRPVGYTTAGAYKDWLECGLSAWRLKTSN